MKNKRKLLFFSFCWFVSLGFAQDATKAVLEYPLIKGQPHSEIFHGIEVSDDFHHLQNLEDTSVQRWFRIQDSLAGVYFNSNKYLDGYLKRFKELQKGSEGDISMIRNSEAGNYFYLKLDAGVEKLYYRSKLDAVEKEIFDPKGYGNISYLKPSFDGQKIAIGFEPEDSFTSRIVIYDLKLGRLLKDEISNINPDFGGIEWLPDCSGFIYLYFPNINNSSPEYKKNSFSVIHLLGDDPQERNFLFGKSETVDIPSDFYPKVRIGSSQDKYIVGYAANSNDYYDAYIAKISDVVLCNPQWKPFFKEEHKVFYDQGEIRGNEFIFRQGSTSGNRLSSVNIQDPDFDSPFILAEGSKESPITDFVVTKDKTYFTRTLYGVEVSLYKFDTLNGIEKIQLPFIPGYLSFFGSSVMHENFGFGIDGWTSDYVRYLVTGESVSKEELMGQVEFPEVAGLISTQIMVPSHDGVEVPLSLVYKEGIDLDSSNEVFIYVYGAYGESLSPFYFPVFLDWAAQGGILAFPHVRGGGEKGKEWHSQGMKTLKYNSWKDLIACTEALIDQGWTRKGLISVYTNSAGGITAGMAVNERPDLFSSFIAEVPRMNPLGLESSSTTNSTSYLEYGTIQDSLEFSGLLKMDPYLNISMGANYPATFIMPSYNDDRIPLWDSGKYIAKLQQANTANTPILMDIDFDSGHENQGEFDAVLLSYGKIFSFAKSNMKP